tara:strand:+ start:429 stop:662 length:234 start_codon:yes stop_codon:yes gene_type:complete
MNATYENDYLIFEVADGPRAIIESLNAKGEEGWHPVTSINVAGSQIIFFIVKTTYEIPDTREEEEQVLSKLWGKKGE